MFLVFGCTYVNILCKENFIIRYCYIVTCIDVSDTDRVVTKICVEKLEIYYIQWFSHDCILFVDTILQFTKIYKIDKNKNKFIVIVWNRILFNTGSIYISNK